MRMAAIVLGSLMFTRMFLSIMTVEASVFSAPIRILAHWIGDIPYCPMSIERTARMTSKTRRIHVMKRALLFF